MTRKLSKALKAELDRDYIGIPKLAALTGRSDRGFHHHILSGRLPSIKVDNPSAVGYKYMVRKEDAVEFLLEQDLEIPDELASFQKEQPESEVLVYNNPRWVNDEPATEVKMPNPFISGLKRYLLTVSLALAGKI